MKNIFFNYFNCNKFKKMVSITVCVCFMMTSVIPARAVYAATEKTEYFEAFSVPVSLGKIISSKYFGDDEIIINIQDLHCHAETQKNIAGILKHIDKNYVLEKTYLEGAFGDIDTKWLADLNNSKVGSAIVDALLNFGYLSGVEYYYAINNKKDFIAGIEDERLYKENIKLLNEIISLHDEVMEICVKLEKEAGNAKREYSNSKTRKFNNFVKRYDKGKISQKRYYGGLIRAAYENGISLEKFRNIDDYEKFVGKANKYKIEKISKHFSSFIDEVKKHVSYKEYLVLSEKSESFTVIENIISELAELDKKYAVSEDLKLYGLKEFFNSVEFSAALNPVELAKEEKELKHEIFLALGRDQYEQEVIELDEFIPTIEGYFTANITSDELAVFNDKFKKFKSVSRSYFSQNMVKKLDKYAELLAKYHNNNLLRDRIFTDNIASSQYGNVSTVKFKSGKKSLLGINKNKKVKVIVTGGFHSRGLEKLFEEKKISYVVIMPKVTGSIFKANNIHLDTIKSYGEMQRNTINIEPLSQEPLLISFPKVLASGIYALETLPELQVYSLSEKEALLQDLIKNILQLRSKGNIYVDKWEIIKSGKKGISEVSVKYKYVASQEVEARDYIWSEAQLKHKKDEIPDIASNSAQKKLFGNPLSILNNKFKDVKSASYKVYSFFIAPVWEEFVFKLLPFGITALFVSNPLFILPAVITAIFGIALFPLAHILSDKMIDNTKNKVRTISDVFYPALALTIIFQGVLSIGMFFAPWYIAMGLAYVVNVALHGTYNHFVLKRMIKGTVLNILKSEKQLPEDAVADNLKKLIIDLEEIFNKRYEADRAVWSVSVQYNYNKSIYSDAVENLKEAAALDKKRQYEIVNVELSNLYGYIISDEVMRQGAFYKKLFLDIKKAMSPVSEYVYYEDGVTLSDALQSKMLDLLIKDTLKNSDKTYGTKEVQWSTAMQVLSNVSGDMPLEEKSRIISLQISNVFSLVKSNEKLAYIIFPLSLFTDNEMTGKPFFLDFLEYFTNRIKAAGENKKEKKDNVEIMMYSFFINAFKLDYAHAFDVIKLMSKLGLLKDKGIPYELKEIIKNYEEIKKYYLVLSKPGVDSEFVEIINQLIGTLNKISIVDDQSLNNRLNEAVKEISILTDIINTSTSPILEYQADKLLSLGSELLKKGDERNGAIIIEALLSVFNKTISKTKNIEYVTLQQFFYSGSSLYENHELLKSLISFFFYTIESLQNEKSRADYNAYDYLYRIAKGLSEYSEKNLNKESIQYKNNSELVLSVLHRLMKVNPERNDIVRSMFNDFGFNSETLSVITESVSGYVAPNKYTDSQVEVSDKFVGKLVENADLLNLYTVLAALHRTGKNGKKLVLAVIEKLFFVAGDISVGKENRIIAASVLAKILSSLYIEINSDISMDIKDVNNILKNLNMSSFLFDERVYIKAYRGSSERKESFSEEIRLSPLVKMLPENVIARDAVNNHSPVYFFVDGKTNKLNYIAAEMRDNFLTLKKILVYNDTALRMLIKLNNDATSENFNELLKIVLKMAEDLKKINAEHGDKAISDVEAMLNFSRTPYSALVYRKKDIRKAALGEIAPDRETLQSQKINSLINEIHQISIRDFMEKIAQTKIMLQDDIRVLNSMQSGNDILAYDLSDSESVNKDVQDLLVRLATGKISLDNLVFMDDIFVWSTKLFAHSVDIFFNFGETDRGININYTESNFNKFGNFERLRYFAAVLTELGFKVELDMNEGLEVDIDAPQIESNRKAASLKAVFNKDSGLNEDTDLVDVAFKTIMLFRYSIHVNHMFNEMVLKSHAKRNTFNTEITSKLVEKFMAGEIWYKYDYEDENAFLSHSGMTERVPYEAPEAVIDTLNKILKYLNLDSMPNNYQKELFDINFLNEHFNEPLERAYASGKIKLNEHGKLEPNEEYDAIGTFLKSVNQVSLKRLLLMQSGEFDEDDEKLNELFSRSRTLNLAGKRNFSYDTIAFLGEYMFVSGYLKLSDGYLSIEGLMNPSTGRMKYAFSEFVDIHGRKKLTNNELKTLLINSGYSLSGEKIEIKDGEIIDRKERFKNRYLWEKTGERERSEIVKGLYREVKNIDSHEIICTGTSDGKGAYVAGNISFDKNDAGKKDILVVPYTTPDDIDAIDCVAAILTTGGGILSHAAITTREKGKTSATLAGASIDGDGQKLNTDYYDQSGKTEEIDGIRFKRVERKRMSLEKGSRVLVNGETGSVLLFNDIDLTLLDELQQYIDKNDSGNIKKFFIKNKNKNEIRRLTEYVFFQVVGNHEHKKTMFSLFDGDLPENVRKKIAELNEVYVRQRVTIVKDALKSLKTIAGKNSYMAYGMAENLIKKLDSTAEKKQEIENLKEVVYEVHENIKNELEQNLDALAKSGERIIRDFDKLQLNAYLSVEKKQLAKKDLREIISINKLSAVYNNFIANTETSGRLIELKNRMLKINSRFNEIITNFQNGFKETFDTGILSFDEIFEEDAFRFGSKTTELAKVKRLLDGKGAKVPAGIAVSVNIMEMYLNTLMEEYKKMVKDETGEETGDYLKSFKEAVRNRDSVAAKEAAGGIFTMIDSLNKKSKIVNEFENKLNKKIQSKLDPAKRVSVRSSGEGEDKENRAYAGIGETHLDVGNNDIMNNLKNTLKAFYSDRSISYMVETGEVVKPAILIQEMVAAEKSAVVFSRNKFGEMTMEALYGLGEGVVGGMFNPDSILIDAETGEIIEYSVADKKLKIVATGKGTKQEIVTKGSQERVFNNAEVKAIAEIIKILENDVKYAIDVELSLSEDGTIYILQRRPITTNNPESMRNIENINSKHSIAVVGGDLSGLTDKIVDMQHPENNDETITFYRAKTERKGDKRTTVLIVDEKYKELMSNQAFVDGLMERLNKDKVVNKRLNPSPLANSGDMALIPLYYDIEMPPQSIINNRKNTNGISKLLSAA